jgi:hypothetical protein
MEAKRLSSLHVSHLTLNNLVGLCGETIVFAQPHYGSLGTLGQSVFNRLKGKTDELMTLVDQSRKNPLTEQLTELDKKRDRIYAEIKREILPALKSSNLLRKAAAKIMEYFLRPYWNLEKEPVVTQTMEIVEIQQRYQSESIGEELRASAETMGISELFASLFSSNEQYAQLFDERAEEESERHPAATSIKGDVVVLYEQFCVVMEQTVMIMPSPPVNKLFAEMDQLRKRYHALTSKTGIARADADPIPPQPYNGEEQEPSVCLRYRGILLEVDIDYTVEYKNNVRVGTATAILRGIGNFNGRKALPFYIERV